MISTEGSNDQWARFEGPDWQTVLLYFSGPVQCDPFGLTSALSFTIAQQQPTFPPKRFDIFSPLTGGCSEGIGAVLVFIFVFAAFDPT